MNLDNKNVCLLHSGIEKEMKAFCTKMDILFAAQDKALAAAKVEMERRLDGMNEFREQLNSQANTFATKVELRNEIDKTVLKLDPLLRLLAVQEGSRKWTDYLAMAGISGAIVLLLRWMMGG